MITARKQSLRRLCFYMRLPVHGGAGVPGQVPPRADTPRWAGTPRTLPQVHPHGHSELSKYFKDYIRLICGQLFSTNYGIYYLV